MIQERMREIDDQALWPLSMPSRGYWIVLGVCCVLILAGVIAYSFQYVLGMGVSGLSVPVGWGTYITNFVFWIGIAHAGTLISAILYLFRTSWRNRISRAAEAMTIFAIMTAGLFPLIHLGRVWVFFWILPYPNWRHLWPNVKSPLVWDVIAVTTYFTISSLFFYLGMIPDIATARDRATEPWRKKLYTIAALGWTGRYEQWRHYARCYLALAALVTPLVISVHSVVSWDFAMSIVHGWHTTIFAPYFVAGAIHSGLAMVIILMIPLRKALKLERLITGYHFEQMALLMVFTGSIIAYAYAVEGFMSWYSADLFEKQFSAFRAWGSWAYSPLFWLMITCNVVVPMTFLRKKWRTNLRCLMVGAILVNLGMWVERFVIIVVSLGHDYLPSSWGAYAPRPVEIVITAFSFGFFFLLFLMFVRLFPAVPMSEIKEDLVRAQEADAPMFRDLGSPQGPAFDETRNPETSGMVSLRARFDEISGLEKALRALKDSGAREYEAYGPVSLVELEDLMPKKGSWVRGWSTVGAFGGMAVFWLLCVLSSLIFALITGGKTPVAGVPFLIPTYEGTILAGGICAFLATLAYAFWRARGTPAGYDARFSSDSFGLHVNCAEVDRARTIEILKRAGAVEIDEH